ncbi:uncharacterized protein DS421_15g493580 [Arachis hypogaea]|nr:uncharacterized protein DS421_15g493580 [Arachis hypogaea]
MWISSLFFMFLMAWIMSSLLTLQIEQIPLLPNRESLIWYVKIFPYIIFQMTILDFWSPSYFQIFV